MYTIVEITHDTNGKEKSENLHLTKNTCKKKMENETAHGVLMSFSRASLIRLTAMIVC